jgi:hypothetical protein
MIDFNDIDTFVVDYEYGFRNFPEFRNFLKDNNCLRFFYESICSETGRNIDCIDRIDDLLRRIKDDSGETGFVHKSFVWRHTNMGHSYWNNINDKWVEYLYNKNDKIKENKKGKWYERLYKKIRFLCD